MAYPQKNLTPAPEPVFRSLNPRGLKPTIEVSPLAPRLSGLDGKVLYVIDSGILGSHLFTEKISDLLSARFPGLKLLYRKTDSLFLTTEAELWEEMKRDADGFIFGPAGGTNGFMFGARWSTFLEKRGIPGLYILSEGYEAAVEKSCQKEGMPLLRRITTPMPAWGDESMRRIEATLDNVVAALTEPLSDAEQRGGKIVPEPLPRIACEGTIEAVQEYFLEERLTDGLPIIPPTEELVARMLSGTSHPANEIVTSEMPPDNIVVTVEKVAINGVMAGCRSAEMPVLLALIEAFTKSQFCIALMSANSCSLMVVVNGPIAREIGMNAGLHAMGPGNRPNAAIGRALRLLITNLGGIIPGGRIMACLGNPTNYSFAFAENEAASPWEPLHVSRGFKKEESCLTLFDGGWTHGGNMTGKSEGPLDLAHILEVIRIFQQPQGAVILLSPPLARRIATEKGFGKKELQEYLWKNALKSAREFRADPYYEHHIKPGLRGKKSKHGISHWPSWYLTADDCEWVPVFGQSEHIHPIVVGGENQAAFQAWSMSLPCTVSIDAWR
jgi:hypothetical protein